MPVLQLSSFTLTQDFIFLIYHKLLAIESHVYRLSLAMPRKANPAVRAYAGTGNDTAEAMPALHFVDALPFSITKDEAYNFWQNYARNF